MKSISSEGNAHLERLDRLLKLQNAATQLELLIRATQRLEKVPISQASEQLPMPTSEKIPFRFPLNSAAVHSGGNGLRYAQ